MRSALRITLLGALASGCGGDAAPPPDGSAPTGDATATNPGTPLEIQTPTPATTTICASCGQRGGPRHRCGRSRWCATCGTDAAPSGHTCRVSRFCADCGFEAAIAGHRCGATRFDPARNADVERDDADDGGAE